MHKSKEAFQYQERQNSVFVNLLRNILGISTIWLNPAPNPGPCKPMITIVAHELLLSGTINFNAKLECEEVWNSSSELLRNFILEKMEDTSMDPNCISSLLESNWS